MKKSFWIILVLAFGLVGLLYSLPKVVVNSKSEGVAAEAADQPKEAASADSAEKHSSSTLTPEQTKQISELRQRFLGETKPEQRYQAAVALSDAFSSFQKFDSAAYYAGTAAEIAPSVESWLRAGDRYYEAFGFVMEEAKSSEFGEKTRSFYQKALKENPTLLAAKANMAMTYVNTPSPMQGIMMLREVLDADPTNELALFNLGILSMRSNQYSKAVDRFKQILVNNPANTKAQFYLAVSLVELGKSEEARKVLTEVKQKEKDPTIQQAIAELEQRL